MSSPEGASGDACDFFGTAGRAAALSDSEDSSTEESVDSATLRAREAEERLVDYGQSRQPPSPKSSLLPSVAALFSKVDGPPAFLDPEATRPLAKNPRHGALPFPQGAAPAGEAPKSNRKERRKATPEGEFDVANLAPTLGTVSESAKRGLPEGAVIEAKAKKYKPDAEEAPQYTAVQVALMGGEIGDEKVAQRPPSGPMEVSEFLHKGGSALLPRKNNDRREREKQKRAKGQSGVSTWKSEAEMALRQQYD
ncbi:unnamed protein product [Ostreobium quekettii]|uniref:Uncharacterized protein n=1 Tax=Ostreobium quekettii TaxID=121088 RepID=A0A8S1JC63_9CHLO|nr:unnamed protein product [Ostreobium quekettii]|eukprot:evm.model.scf_141.6 EVM.evm.TU.scf_141.6   scf_141:100799-105747(-)